MRKIAMALTALGIFVAIYAFVSRFVYDRTALGFIIQYGVAPTTLMIGANTLFLLAILAKLFDDKKQE
jgi:hypothetical protein